MSCASSKGGYNQIICNPTNKEVENGDILIIDTGSTFDGYFCDFDRNFGFGKISQESKDAYKVLWEATEAGLNKSKPGSTCAEINNAMVNVLKKSGLKSNSIGRMGHGLGLQVTAPPSIFHNDKTVLKSLLHYHQLNHFFLIELNNFLEVLNTSFVFYYVFYLWIWNIYIRWKGI